MPTVRTIRQNSYQYGALGYSRHRLSDEEKEPDIVCVRTKWLLLSCLHT